MGTSFWDRVAADYDAAYTSAWSHSENSVIADMIRNHIPRDAKVTIDLGCGTGLAIDFLPDDFRKGYLGIDFSMGMIQRASRKHPGMSFVVADLNQGIPIQTSTANVVISTFGSLSYLSDVRDILVEIRRILSPDGIAFLMFMNRWSLRRLMSGKIFQEEQFGTRSIRSEADCYIRTYSHRAQRTHLHGAGLQPCISLGVGIFSGLLESPILWSVDRNISQIIPGLSHMSLFVAKPR